jgi:hypothetical protein
LRTDDFLTDEDNSSTEDPFRLVLFDDIRNYLFPIKTNAAKIQLIYGFFNYLGLNFNPCMISKHNLFMDSFLHREAGNENIMKEKFFNDKDGSGDGSSAYGMMDDRARENSGSARQYLGFPIKVFPQQIDNLFNNGKWFAMYDEVDISNADLEFAG